MTTPRFLMTDAGHYDVSYAINPWMRPDAWSTDPDAASAKAKAAFDALRRALVEAGAQVETMPGLAGAPDLVFPANAGVILDGTVVPARFKHPQRNVEEPAFLRRFEDLVARGVLDTIEPLPDGLVQEGAGDFVHDVTRDLAWCGHGQRSQRAGNAHVAEVLGCDAVHLELVSPRQYHLDVALTLLPNGEVLYYPPAFSASSSATIREIVDGDRLIVASDEDAARFCVNAVSFGRTVVMASAAPRLRSVLRERGYDIVEVDLSSFIMSGGGAYCMTLRLDRSSRKRDEREAAE